MYRYKIIASEIENNISSNQLKRGEKVASVRLLCTQYKCHQSTALKALNFLKEKGIVYSVPQSGFYVAGVTEIEERDVDYFDFSSTSPNPSIFPYEDYQECINIAIKQNKQILFDYSKIEGYLPLKKAIVDLVTDDYIFTSQNNVVITSGIQQSLAILSKMDFFNDGHQLLIEQPSYHRYIEFLKNEHHEVVTIDRTFEGIDLDELESILRTGKIKFFYTMPRVHNPLGTMLDSKTKEKLVELAYKYNVYVIEDDYMGDYITDKSNDPLFTYDYKKSHVIYLRSLSKIIFPGLRVGFAILPSNLQKIFESKKYYQDMGTSLLSQASLEVYLTNGMFRRHSARMLKIYSKKAAMLKDFLDRRFVCSSMNQFEQNLMIHTVVRLSNRYDETMLSDHNILISNMAKHYYDDDKKPDDLLSINVSNLNVERLKQGLEKLGELVLDQRNGFDISKLHYKEYSGETEIKDFYRRMVEYAFEVNGIDDQQACTDEIEDKIKKLNDYQKMEGKLLLFYLDYKLVGTISYSEPNELLLELSNKICHCELGTVFIDPTHHRKGLLNMMIKRLKEELVRANIDEICFDCGYQIAQEIWTHKYGEATEIFKDYWSKDSHHMIWHLKTKDL